MRVRRVDPIPYECVVRGYLAGSGWREYREGGSIGGDPLPRGLRESERLPEPIFTPAVKAQTGHDENISRAELSDRAGVELATELERVSLALYQHGADHAESRGLILADTKFEFGRLDGRLILIDELLTPDSSRATRSRPCSSIGSSSNASCASKAAWRRPPRTRATPTTPRAHSIRASAPGPAHKAR